MSRVVTLLLEAGLIVSAIAAIAYAVRLVLSIVFGTNWFWGGALGAFAGPVAFAAALSLYSGRVIRTAGRTAE